MNKVVIIGIVVVLIVVIAVVVYFMMSSRLCSTYADSDVNVSDTCIKDIWSNVAKCPNYDKDNIDYYIASKATMTKAAITSDAKLWASMTDDAHRKSCYGNDRTKWP